VGPEVHMAGSSVTLVSALRPEDAGNMCLRKLRPAECPEMRHRRMNECRIMRTVVLYIVTS
jgi:hypothetical protein